MENLDILSQLDGPRRRRPQDRRARNAPQLCLQAGKAECLPPCNAACDDDSAVQSDSREANQWDAARRLRSFPAVPYQSPACLLLSALTATTLPCKDASAAQTIPPPATLQLSVPCTLPQLDP